MNRTTSAVMYVRNSGEPLIFHNYSAERPLPAGIFACKELTVIENGTFHEVDFSAQSDATTPAKPSEDSSGSLTQRLAQLLLAMSQQMSGIKLQNSAALTGRSGAIRSLP